MMQHWHKYSQILFTAYEATGKFKNLPERLQFKGVFGHNDCVAFSEVSSEWHQTSRNMLTCFQVVKLKAIMYSAAIIEELHNGY